MDTTHLPQRGNYEHYPLTSEGNDEHYPSTSRGNAKHYQPASGKNDEHYPLASGGNDEYCTHLPQERMMKTVLTCLRGNGEHEHVDQGKNQHL